MPDRIAASSLLAVVLLIGSQPAWAASGCINPNIVSTVAGQSGQAGNNDGFGAAARFALPVGAAVDLAGNVYVASGVLGTGASPSRAVRKITPEGVVSTLAGDANALPALVDGQGAAARFSAHVNGVAIDAGGTLYVTDRTTIRRITPQGWVSTLAGSSLAGYRDGPAASALFANLDGIAVDGTGNIYVTDQGTVRKLTPAGMVSTVAGVPASQGSGSADGFGTSARFAGPSGLAAAPSGDLYVADRDNATIRRIAPSGWVGTIAGRPGVRGSSDGAGSAAAFNGPVSLALDAGGSLYVSDLRNFTIRRIDDPRGAAVVTTVAGTALQMGYADGAGPAARFGQVVGLAWGRVAGGEPFLHVTDNTSHLARRIGCPPAARLVDGSFERPPLPIRTFQYAPANGGWRFSGGAGVQSNGSAWRAAPAVDGVQTAFLQNFGAQVAQTVDLIEGSYSVSFSAARRAGQSQPIQVAINGVPLGAPVTPADNTFRAYTTPAVNLPAGSHTLEFRSVGPGPDNSSFVDAVTLNRKPIDAVPVRHGLTFGLSPNASTPAGMVEMSCQADPGKLDNPHANQCNPYQGDMSCERALPVLCFDPATGMLSPTSQPVVGSTLGNFVGGAETCQVFATTAGHTRMADFHDGGGWRIQGLRGPNLVPGQRYWVHIRDQPANCWDK